MEEVVGAFQRQVFQADNEVTQVEVLSEEWKERASKELGEVEEQVEKFQLLKYQMLWWRSRWRNS